MEKSLSFLTSCTQTVIIDGVQSEKIHIASGIPQGTALGPILFLVYINDFSESIKHIALYDYVQNNTKKRRHKQITRGPCISSKIGEGLAHVVPFRQVVSPQGNN